MDLFNEILTVGRSAVGHVAEQGKPTAPDVALNQPFRSPLGGRSAETAALFTKYKKASKRKTVFGAASIAGGASSLPEPANGAQPSGEFAVVVFHDISMPVENLPCSCFIS